MIVPLTMLGALVAGILAGEQLGGGPARILLGTALCGFGIAFGYRHTRPAVVFVVAACVLLGSAVEQRALHGLERSPLTVPVASDAEGEAVLTLAEDPDGPTFESGAIARVDSFGGRDAGERRVFVVVQGDERSVFGALEAGDRLRATGTMTPLHGFSTRLRWQHAVGEFRVDDIRAVARPDSLWYGAANGARRAVLRGSATLPATPRALLTGFLLGDTRAIPDDLVVAFRDAGLSHLLAVSGANVAFALAVVEPALRRLRRGPRLIGGLGVLVLFGTMTRWEPSVLRASVMVGLVMLARLLGRPAEARRVLVLAMLGLLAADPFLLHSVGFLLSCGACAGIVVFAAPCSARLRGPSWFREALAVTTAAQIGVAPVLLTTFGTIPLIALPANLVAAPFVGPLTVWGLVAGLVGGVLGPGVAWWLQLPTLAMLRGIEWVARSAATAPLALDPTQASWLTAAVALVAGTRWWRTRTGSITGRGRRIHREGKRSDPARP